MDMNMYDDELEEPTGNVDVCPSCGILLNGIEELLTVGCNDPMGCGAYLIENEEDCEENEEDYGIDELNFDN